MKRYLITALILSIWSSVCFAYYTIGSDFIINNNSDHEMTKTGMSSYQMAEWNFPDSIPAQQSLQSRVEFDWPYWWGTPENDSGSVTYQVTCPAGTQTIVLQTLMKTIYTYFAEVVYHYEPGFVLQSSGSNCVATQPAFNEQFSLVQDGFVLDQIVVTVTNIN
jgi:hypothetical protein